MNGGLGYSAMVFGQRRGMGSVGIPGEADRRRVVEATPTNA
jgi:hypothetical protein